MAGHGNGLGSMTPPQDAHAHQEFAVPFTVNISSPPLSYRPPVAVVPMPAPCCSSCSPPHADCTGPAQWCVAGRGLGHWTHPQARGCAPRPPAHTMSWYQAEEQQWQCMVVWTDGNQYGMQLRDIAADDVHAPTKHADAKLHACIPLCHIPLPQPYPNRHPHVTAL